MTRPLPDATIAVYGVSPSDPSRRAHLYSFFVDGVQMIDPQNRWIHAGLTPTTSILLVPGDTPACYEEQEVPRGMVHIHRHRSTTPADRQIHVIIPATGTPSTRQWARNVTTVRMTCDRLSCPTVSRSSASTSSLDSPYVFPTPEGTVYQNVHWIVDALG